MLTFLSDPKGSCVDTCYTVRCSTDGIPKLARKDTQVNIRLAPERYEVLEAEAFVRGISSPGKLAQQIIEDSLLIFQEEDEVKQALDARWKHQSRDSKKVRPITVKTRKQI